MGDDSRLSLLFHSGSTFSIGVEAVTIGSLECIRLDNDNPPLPNPDPDPESGLDRNSGETVDSGGSVIPPPTFAGEEDMIDGLESGGGSKRPPLGDSGLI